MNQHPQQSHHQPPTNPNPLLHTRTHHHTQVVKAQAADRAARLAPTNGGNALRLPEKGPVEPASSSSNSSSAEPPVLELLAALIRTRHWSHAALPAWRQLEQAGLCPIEAKGVAAALRSLVAHVIAPHYPAADPVGKLPLLPAAAAAAASNKGGKQAASSSTTSEGAAPAASSSKMEEGSEGVIAPPADLMDVPAVLAPLLGKLGPYLADDPVLYARVVRVLKVRGGR